MRAKCTHYTVHIGLEQPCCMAFLSDWHNSDYEKWVFEQLDQQKPDFVVSAGDMVTAKGGRCAWDHAASLIQGMSEKYPVYLAPGNHELRMKERSYQYGDQYERYLREITLPGVHIVDNASEKITFGGKTFCITGLSIPLDSYHRRKRLVITKDWIERKIEKNVTEDEYQILLAHHPDFFRAYADWGADLTLSGHVHGGVVRIPFLGGVFGATWRLFPEYTRGAYKIGAKKMIVSAGLGAHTIKFRFNNPKQLIFVHIN